MNVSEYYPWVASLVAGLVAAIAYFFSHRPHAGATEKTITAQVLPKYTASVFIVVAIVVYCSVYVVGKTALSEANAPMLTGEAPF